MSVPAGVVIGSSVERDETLEVDACIIGSGAAGGVVARELAEVGLSVVVLEEGGYYDKDDYGRLPPSETFRRLYRDGGLTAAIGPGSPAIALPLGRAVGGSTVVNGGVCFRAPGEVLDTWERLGLAWNRDEVTQAFERVEEVLEVGPMPEAVLGGNSRAFRRGCQKLGLHVEVMKRNTPGCDGCCRCIFGCPGDKKKAIHLSYIPRALAKGARVYADCRAEEILIENGRAVGVRAVVLDRASERVRARLTVRARAVVVAAGAIHSPGILGRQGLGGASGALGRNLALHPSCRVLAEFDEPIDGHRGAFQGLFSKALEHEKIKLNGIFLPPGILGGTMPFVGKKARDGLARYRHMGAFGVMVSDKSVGRVRSTPFGTAIQYSIDREDAQGLVRGVVHAARTWFAAGAKRVYPGIRGLAVVESESDLAKIVPSRVKATDLELAAFHPMGTARMSPDPKRGVLRPDLQHHAIAGLYVPDASWFPTSILVNPQMTIMAFATLAARGIERSLTSGRARRPVAATLS